MNNEDINLEELYREYFPKIYNFFLQTSAQGGRRGVDGADLS